MSRNDVLWYLVEGGTEQKVIAALKNEYLYPGDVQLCGCLVQAGFRLDRFWSGTPQGVYADFENESRYVKINSEKNKKKK